MVFKEIRRFKVREIFINFVRFYQIYISPILPKSCRYYPSCSEYAVWQFRFNSLPKALFLSFKRVLRCNQLFKGGIDYPVVKKKFKKSKICKKKDKMKIIFWFVPFKQGKYYVVKTLDFKKEK